MGIRRLLATSAFACAAMLAAATTAAADGPRAPRAMLRLTITADVVVGTGVTLTCSPTGGNHANAAKACASLRRAGGNLNRLPRELKFCTMQYAPVIAAAHGYWYGKPVAWQRKFGNRCELDSATGWVFRF